MLIPALRDLFHREEAALSQQQRLIIYDAIELVNSSDLSRWKKEEADTVSVTTYETYWVRHTFTDTSRTYILSHEIGFLSGTDEKTDEYYDLEVKDTASDETLLSIRHVDICYPRDSARKDPKFRAAKELNIALRRRLHGQASQPPEVLPAV